ncbi:hypothetical protein M378DRAFT_200069 [Amanita muscaria Koide BX008]|uniref:Six-hairpin glycosidase n=1 Tax=Amanita muscaria (strain Koide BX008) TaxID=946122 RepID=A0A0C2WSD2_AMAMK|nr:hypothetical protein M378DRAFT_200069 [Amanita muscaria Koide BX008]
MESFNLTQSRYRSRRGSNSSSHSGAPGAGIWRTLVSLAFVIALSPSAAQAQNLTDTQVALVSGTLADSAQQSWELGTRAQTILSLNATAFSVYTASSLPPPTSIDAFGSGNSSTLSPFFDIARTVVQNRTASNGNVTGPQPLIQDGSAADPASIGFAVLLANWTGLDSGEVDYAGAARDQLDFLFQKVPKTPNGAISHRVDQVQLWSDFVYMVPPFLAYYGVTTSNRTLIEEAYTQIKLYRTYLRDPSANGLWKHVLLGTGALDDGHWSTGNGWAAAGMLRVLATMKHSQYSSSFSNEQRDLADWTLEIQNGMYQTLDSTLIFTNWAGQPPSSSNFRDASSTALLASTVFRLSLLYSYHHNLPIAERCRQALFASGNRQSSSISSSYSTALADMNHFTMEGYLSPVVNPHSFNVQGNTSAEAQAFVLELHAAWSDWIQDGAQGANGATPLTSTKSFQTATLASVGLGAWLLL